MCAASLSFARTPDPSGCTILPANSVWNTAVDKLPVDKNSAAYIATMNATKSTLYPVFNSTGWGMPFNVVSGSHAKSPVYFYYGESDPGPYPVGSDIVVESGADRHAITIDKDNCVLYEIFNLTQQTNGWMGGSGAVYPLNSNALRKSGWTSADAAGLPIFPGMVRIDEVLAGHIDHALRVTADHTRNQYIWPARHAASRLSGTQYPPMGQRFRLKASFNISGYAPQARVILQALKTYGMILADNGPSWDLTGTGDSRWDDAALNSMKRITGNNFEAVDESSLIVDTNSAQVNTSMAKPAAAKWVNVISKNSGKCLDITGGVGATQPTAKAEQWTCVGSAQTNQHFQLVATNGGYEIQVRNSTLALQPESGSSSTASSTVEQWGFESKTYQIWNSKPNADGTFSFTLNSNPKLCLDVSGASKNNGARVQVWTCNGGMNQEWSLTPVN